MRPSFRHLLSLAALLAAGCDLRLYPEDPVFAYGRVLRADGSPLPGASLSFDRAREPEYDIFAPYIPTEFSPFPTAAATTEADGSFTLELLEGHTSTYVRQGESIGYRFRLVSPMEEGRAAILSFFMGGDVELPPLRPWVADLSVGEGAEGLAVSFAPPPPRPELPPGAQGFIVRIPQENRVEVVVASKPLPVVQLIQGGEVAWQQVGVASPWTVGPWLLEDFQGLETMVRAQSAGEWDFVPLGGLRSRLGFRQEWRSERLPLPAAARRPVSRGASCEPLPAGTTSCPWTDGELVSVELPRTVVKPPGVGSQPREVGPESLRLTLAAPARPSRIVIRGLAARHVLVAKQVERFVVEGSEDGERWVTLGELNQVVAPGTDPQDMRFGHELGWAGDNPFDPPLLVHPMLAAYLEGGLRTDTPVRHVRLRATSTSTSNPAELRALREVSLFE
jgi:hypothetical protein